MKKLMLLALVSIAPLMSLSGSEKFWDKSFDIPNTSKGPHISQAFAYVGLNLGLKRLGVHEQSVNGLVGRFVSNSKARSFIAFETKAIIDATAVAAANLLQPSSDRAVSLKSVSIAWGAMNVVNGAFALVEKGAQWLPVSLTERDEVKNCVVPVCKEVGVPIARFLATKLIGGLFRQ